MEDISKNSDINALVLGKAHVYLNSQFNYYSYDLNGIILEHNKIMSHKQKLLKYINNNVTYANTLKTYTNILEFNCVRLQDKIKIVNERRNKRGIINGPGTIIKNNYRKSRQ